MQEKILLLPSDLRLLESIFLFNLESSTTKICNFKPQLLKLKSNDNFFVDRAVAVGVSVGVGVGVNVVLFGRVSAGIFPWIELFPWELFPWEFIPIVNLSEK